MQYALPECQVATWGLVGSGRAMEVSLSSWNATVHVDCHRHVDRSAKGWGFCYFCPPELPVAVFWDGLHFAVGG